MPDVEKLLIAAAKAIDVGDEAALVNALVAGAADAVPAKYRPLLRPLSQVPAADSALAWTLASPGKPLVKTDKYALNLAASAQLAFDAAAKWPSDTASPKLLSIGASGRVTTDAKASLPYAFGSLSGQASASVQTSLDYYFKPTDDPIFGLAVAARLGHLPYPFDLDAVWSAFQQSDLEGLVFGFGGAASASMQVAFADALSLGAGVKADIGLTVDVSASLKSDYTLALRRRVNDGQFAVTAHLSRNRIDESKFGEALTIEVDVSALTKPVAAALTQAMSEWDSLLDEVKPFLSPGTWLRKQAADLLQIQFGPLIHNADLRAALLQDLDGALGLGDPGDPQVFNWLTDQVTGAIDRASALVKGSVDDAAGRVLTILSADLPFFASLVPADQLKNKLASLIQAAEDKLEAAAKALTAKPADAVAKALKAAGATVTGAVDKLDGALAAVRDLLTKCDQVLQAILKKAQEAATKRITARLYFEETTTNKVEVEVVGTFSGLSDASRAAYHAMAVGKLKGLTRLIETTPHVAGFDLDAEQSSIKRFSQKVSKQGLEIAFLNVLASASEVVTGAAQVEVDGFGNVHVDTQGKLEKLLSVLSSKREVSLVDTHALVLAAQMAAAQQQDPAAPDPKLELGLSVVYGDKSLNWDDFSDFTDSLVTPRLLTTEQVNRAKAVFARWKADGGKVKEIAAAMTFKGREVVNLIHPQQALTLEDRKRIADVAIAALLTYGGLRKADFYKGKDLAKGLFIAKPKPDDVTEIALRYAEPNFGIYPIKRPEGDAPPYTGNTPNIAGPGDLDSDGLYVDFLGQAYALRRLVDFIDLAGQVYRSRPIQADPVNGWTEKKYRDVQAQMGGDTAYWLTVFNTVADLFSAKITSRTISVMRTLSTLSGRGEDKPGGVTISMTYQPKTGQAETVSFSEAQG